MELDPHSDSFLFHLRFLCMAYFHYRALNDFWCLCCKFPSRDPNCPMLSIFPQLKSNFW